MIIDIIDLILLFDKKQMNGKGLDPTSHFLYNKFADAASEISMAMLKRASRANNDLRRQNPRAAKGPSHFKALLAASRLD